MSRGVRVRRSLIAGVLAVLPLAACSDTPDLAAPPPLPSVAPVRYADESFDAVTATRDVTYATVAGPDGEPLDLTLDVYEPVGDTETDRPALVWVHGGAFTGGDKRTGPSAELARFFARRGYVTVSINYRLLAPEGCFDGGPPAPECVTAGMSAIEDAQAAVRWLRRSAERYGVDPDRIGIGGESAGGITATGVGLLPGDNPDAGDDTSATVQAWMSLSGGLPGGLLADSADPPGLLFSGTADTIIPYAWSVDTVDALEAADVPATLETFEGAGHVPFDDYRDRIEQTTVAWFYRYLVRLP